MRAALTTLSAGSCCMRSTSATNPMSSSSVGAAPGGIWSLVTGMVAAQFSDRCRRGASVDSSFGNEPTLRLDEELQRVAEHRRLRARRIAEPRLCRDLLAQRKRLTQGHRVRLEEQVEID